MFSFKKIKKKWQVNNKQLFLILLIFSLTGLSILLVVKPIFAFLFKAQIHSPIFFIFVRIPLFILLYYFFFLFWGLVLGQFNFCWQRTKRLFLFPFKLFKFKK